MAIGNLWLWLIPLVWGWYAIGSHHGRRNDVASKLRNSVSDIKLADGTQAQAGEGEVAAIRIRESRFTLIKAQTLKYQVVSQRSPNQNSLPDQTSANSFAHEASDDFATTIFGSLTEGDSLQDGPFYNYARCGTWSHVSRFILQSYINTIVTQRKVAQGKAHDGSTLAQSPHPVQADPSEDTTGDPKYSIALERCKIDGDGPVSSFGWIRDSKKDDTDWWFRMIVSFLVAFIFQGMTGWTAFMIAYATPTIGIGCRSLIYMIYNLVSAFSCLFLLIASLCSDHLSHKRECANNYSSLEGAAIQAVDSHQQGESPSAPAISSPSLANGSDLEVGNNHAQYNGDQSSTSLAAFSVFFLLLGKTLAIGNALLLVTGCFLQFIGIYQNCFCTSSYIGLRGKAYIVFLTSQELAQIARPYWYVGIVITVAAVLFACIAFEMIRRNFKDDQEE